MLYLAFHQPFGNMFRVWDSTNGKQLCSLQGHKGRGVWRCFLHPDRDQLITAGADSSIKIWALADWMPGHHPMAAQTSDAFILPPLPEASGRRATAVAIMHWWASASSSWLVTHSSSVIVLMS